MKPKSKSSTEFPTARKLERMAKRVAASLRKEGEDVEGVKCWYSDAALIDKGAERAFVGINPGLAYSGELRAQERRGYLKAPYNQRRYSAWLDQEWGAKGPRHQAAGRQLFQVMYGSAWENKLRSTACFNVSPFPTKKASQLSRRAWNWSASWFRQVLEHVNPRLLVCNGNGATGRSPWAVVSSAYGINHIQEIPIGAKGSTASIKHGRIGEGPLSGCRVIGVPFLGYFAWPEMFDKMKMLGPFT